MGMLHARNADALSPMEVLQEESPIGHGRFGSGSVERARRPAARLTARAPAPPVLLDAQIQRSIA